MNQQINFDIEQIKRYDKAGPRYTSYPTALEFDEQFSHIHYQHQIELSDQRGGPLSLYFHIPFCDTVCFYCACNKIVTKNRRHAEPYLNNLHKEIEMQSALFDTTREVKQLHWGGGTPTFLSHQQMRDLMAKTRQHFKLADDDNGEFSIEIDPREADVGTIALLREIGFNRLSLGVQDFNPTVQKAVNRIQSEQETFAIIEAARVHQFKSISLDLIYGLPHQTTQGFLETLDKVIRYADPDRLSIFNYAHMPERFKVQRQIRSEDLPSSETKLEILQKSIEKLSQAGYVYIGMDHFAKPDDELAIAQRDNKLYRNFQGYSTHSECDLIGFGITSIGSVGDSFSQNYRTLEEYDESINKQRLPVFRGKLLSQDDKIRAEIISQLICHFHLNIASIEHKFNITFADYFAKVLPNLDQFVADGLIMYDDKSIDVSASGRLLIRNICMAFDFYLQHKKEQQYSKVI